jgi:ribose transport system ATP-binding protein
MGDELVLQMQGIRKAFPGVVALDGVNLEVRRGEVHVLLGENGAGKSTLMKILSGAYQRDGGRVLLDGREAEIKSPRQARALGVSIIYQELNLVPHLSAAENIFLGREPLQSRGLPGLIDRRAMREAAGRILTGLGADFDPRRPVKELSIAGRQMVEIAKAVSLDARILIMDEPTSALTERESRELFARIRRLKAEGVAVIYISHRLEEVFEIGDRVTVLRDGRHVATRDIRDVTKPELIRLMADRELTEQFPKVTAPRGREVLRVEGLGRRGALEDVSFSLFEGEVLGVAGLLGAGRTALARVLFGLDRADAGRVFLKGRRQQVTSPRRAINLGLGFLTEDRKSQGLVLPLSVQENVCLPSVERFSRLGVMRPDEEAQAAGRYIRDLRIKATGPRHKVVYLSGGNQQKVVLAKWLCARGDILIFDEPTRGIDVGAKAEIYQLMNQLTAAGAAIIMISSELPEILGMSDRILVMHRGRVSGEFAAAEATQERVLRRALGEPA